jgi:hypothetical protein
LEQVLRSVVGHDGLEQSIDTIRTAPKVTSQQQSTRL